MSDVALQIQDVAAHGGKVFQLDPGDVADWSFDHGAEVIEADGARHLGDHFLNIRIKFKPGKRAQWVTPDGSAE